MPKREKRVVETSICFMYLSKKLCLCYLFVLFEGLVADQYINNVILTNRTLLIKICIRTSLLCKKKGRSHSWDLPLKCMKRMLLF